MKRICILFIAFAAICTGACEQVSDLKEKLENTASIVLAEGQETDIDIAPKGETVSIKFKSTLEWKTEYETNTSDDDWFQMIPKSGKGGDSVCKIKVGKNDSGKKRSVSIYIISEDVKEEFKLTQKSLETNNDDDEEEEENGGGNTNGYLVNYEVPHADVKLAAGAAYSSRVSETNGGSAYAYIYETNTSNQRIVTHTFSNNGIHRNYTFLYDYEKRCPIWLAYHLNNGFCSTSGNRSENWAYDPAIPEASQPDLSSSYSSGGNPYNRGHMLASHCRAGITNANTQTFYYTNMTPQLSASFNTSSGVWNKLEGAEEGFTPSAGSRDTLYVVTGCLFDANVKTMTCAKDGMECAVPDDFYKCFMLCSFDSSGKMTGAKGIGYLMPHETPVGTGYSGFAKSIDEIEALAGFDFFCNVPETFQNSAEANKTALF